MLFNSIEFAIFLPVVFLIYWFVVNRSLRLQNTFLLAASYFFYGWWDWRFLLLIMISSLADYSIGLALNKQSNQAIRKSLLFTSIFLNIGLLGFFKYYNFFVESFIEAFSFLGYSTSPGLLNIILPVGISFYTFQTLSYTIDVYKNKLQPTKDIISFFTFVSFFPQLVAGPIERAKNLLPQFYTKRYFNPAEATDGMRQILWGFFKKIVIADNCAFYVDDIFTNYQNYPGSTLFLGVFFFSIQIYGDFSGYSDIAIGTAKLFGINLMRNFSFPYFSRDIAEFWRRWHISLSSWFKDYIYIPLGGSRTGSFCKVRNIFIIFIVSGFWHGANWTYIFWGLLHACYFLPLMFLKRNRKNLDIVARDRLLPNFIELLNIGSTFLLVMLAWIFFRAENITKAFDYLFRMINPSIFSLPHKIPIYVLGLIIFLIIIEWLQRDKQHALQIDDYKFSKFLRWGCYYFIIFLIMIFGATKQTFIYFQF